MTSETVTKKSWPFGLWCVACGNQIHFGTTVLWVPIDRDASQAWCAPCRKATR